jgi:hypothetical protein
VSASVLVSELLSVSAMRPALASGLVLVSASVLD